MFDHFLILFLRQNKIRCPYVGLYLFCMIQRYQNYRQEDEEEMVKSKEFAKTALFFNNEYPRGFNGDTWDAKHLTSFLSRSNYSNWRGNQPNISHITDSSHKRSYSSTQGDHFFKTTKQDKNQSKIGFTPIFPLVTNPPIAPIKQISLRSFFNSTEIKRKDQRAISGRKMKLQCSPQDKFIFEGNAVKYQATDPITMINEKSPLQTINGFKKQRMSRLISSRHPHGMTGIDHPQNPESNFYSVYEEKIKIREQPNSHNSFLIDRQWKSKKRSVPPVDQWKNRKALTIRKSRNENIHGYNIITNRYYAE